ncbi:trypsin-like peptidase domain-containing protein [Cellulosimicrobium cellulans]|uniref:S1C family serine protease n=1 Tax=Cellulosimicrobium cellulans TaxID=1710 RepID=UPI001EDA56A1|nr:trypsin-like peptidase domain-containing protein [Cellulosimicrobium cellulans]UKJ64257.1 trypsin-like peptidase domain-containing protein [Cellulosimicrobium cellulans]
MTDPQTGPRSGPEHAGAPDAGRNPFAPPSAYRSVPPVPPSTPVGPGPVPPPPGAPVLPSSAAPQPSPAPAPAAGPAGAPGPADPWQTLRSFGEPEPPSAPTRPGGSVDPTLVGVPRGAAGAPSGRGLRPAVVAGVAVLALVAGALGGVAADRLLGQDSPGSSTSALPPASVEPGADRPAGSVADIAATVLPSVVSLQVRGTDGVATGSGFVLREDGYILTNNHVVASAADGGDVVVLFSDGHESPAELVGRTVDYDLAVVKVDDSGLTPLALGDSDGVVVGDPVVAVGAPLGLNGTVTTGIISALNRPVQAGAAAETAFINAIQTDAAINPGNSGGPLVNGRGEVVGINSAIAQPPGSQSATGSIGLGFAIPSNQARRTAEQLIADGVATYPVIGVLLDQGYQGEGVQVSTQAQAGNPAVTPDGPADTAGIRPGDVILSIDDRPVTESDELIVAIRAKAPGDAVTLRVRTGDRERDVRVVLDEATSE